MKKYIVCLLASFCFFICAHSEQLIGTIAGTLDVSPTGAATYTIPIDLLASPNEFVPSISLSYDSQAGNSIGGYGWSISGLSSICIGQRTSYFDNAAEGLYEGRDNAYYLDGMRLLLVSGQNGQLGATYRTEQDNGSIIRIDSVVAGGPSMFTVLTTDGSIYKYGSQTGRMYYSNDTCYSWAMDYAEDRLGNYIIYEYAQDGILYPIGIRYGRNKNNDTTPLYSISFTYTSRTDSIPVHLFEHKSQFGKKLTSIVCTRHNVTYRTYQLTYESGVYSRLVSVKETRLSSSYPETTFVWEDLPEYNLSISSPSVGAIPSQSFSDMCFFAGDTDNDGQSELVALYNNYTSPTPFIAANVWKMDGGNGNFVSANNYTSQAGISIVDMYEGMYHGGTISHASHRADNSLILPYYSNLFGDRQMNFNCIKEGLLLNYPLRSTATDARYIISDIDNDGMDDIVMVEQAKLSGSYPATLIHFNLSAPNMTYSDFSMNLAGKPTRIVAMDINRDGMPDLLVCTTNGFYIYWNHAGSFSDANRYHNATFGECDVLELGDFNNDGLPDLVVNKHNSTTWLCGLNQGTTTNPFDFIHITEIENRNAGNSNPKKAYCLVQDINADGKSDLIVGFSNGSSSAKLIQLKSEGNSFVLHREDNFPSIGTFPAQSKIVQGDFDGDGVPEIMYYGGELNSTSTTKAWHKLKFEGYKPSTNRITQITDGLGCKQHIEYGLLTNDTVYERTASSTFPLLTMRSPLSVVRRIETVSSSDTLSTTYKYGDAIFHWQGKGLLGFKSKTTTTSNGEKTIQKNDVNGSYYFLYPLSEDLYAGDGTLWKYNRQNNYFVSAGQKRYRLHSVSSRTDDLPNGSLDLYAKAYDSYGACVYDEQNDNNFDEKSEITMWEPDNPDLYIKNLPILIETYKNGGTYGTEETERIEYTRNVIGQPLTCKRYLNETLLETEIFTYNTCGQVLTYTTIYGSSTDSLTTTYAYTNGLLTSVTNPLDQTTQYQYNNRGLLYREHDHLGINTIHLYDGMLREKSCYNSISRTDRTYAASDYGHATYKIREEVKGKPTKETHYDNLGRKVAEAEQRFDGRWLYIDYSYLPNGEVGFVSFPHIGTTPSSDGTYNTYDVYHRRTSQTDTQGKISTWVHTPGQVEATVNGVTRTYQIAARELIVEVEDDSGYAYYEYDAGERLLEVGHNNMSTYIEYDDYGRISKTTDMQGTVRTYTYDSNGYQHTVAQGASVYTTNYDKYGRLLAKTFHDEGETDKHVYYRYNDRGQVVCDSSSNYLYTYSYDNYGRISGEEQHVYNDTQDEFISTAYYYNNLNQISQKCSYILDTGLIKEYYTYSNGWKTTICLEDTIVWNLTEEDNHGFPIQTNSHLDTLTYNHDIYGHLLYMHSANRPSVNASYTYDITTGNPTYWNGQCQYDALNRLKKWGNYCTYSYDDEGNITAAPFLQDIQYDDFKLSSYYGDLSKPIFETYQRMNLGYRKSMERTTEIEDYHNRLEFSYNGDGQRTLMKKYTNVSENPALIGMRYYLNDNYEIDDNITTRRQFYYVGGSPYDAPAVLLIERGRKKLYQIYRDNIGSITMYARADEATKRFKYTPWGQRYSSLVLPPNGPYNIDEEQTKFIRYYTGHEELPYFYLLNTNARIYDPNLGRFLSPDPILATSGGPLDMNPYVYARNNPLSYVDQDGEFPFLFLAAVLFGGAMNLATNWGSISNWKQGLAFFAVGAAAGVGSALGFSPISSALLGGANSVLSQGFTNGWKNIQWGQVALTTGSSFVTSVLTGYVGDKINAPITKLTSHISNSVIRETLNGTLGNAATGFIVGTGMSLVTGNDLKTSLRLGANAAASAGIVGGIGGFVKGIEIRNTGRIQKNDPYYLLQEKNAKMQYPNKAGNYELHHKDPQYMGGNKNGELIKINAALHQVVTNAFRKQHPYGLGKLQFNDRLPIMRKIYMKYPLPY